MPVISTATFHAVSDFAVKHPESYFFKKGIDKLLAAAEKTLKMSVAKRSITRCCNTKRNTRLHHQEICSRSIIRKELLMN